MRLTVQPLEIGEDEGFSDDKDIFKRKAFGERLTNLVENTDGELVIALDAPWGEGKSTFVKMWRGHLKNKNNGVHSIYFDAFENDHQKSAFLTLAGEIYNSIDKTTEKSAFEQKVLSAAKTGGSIGLDILARILSGGALSGEILEGHAKKIIGDKTADAMDNMDRYVSHSLKSVSANKIAIRGFKEYLEALPQKLSYNGKSIVFIIDELDRCKPTFALEIVEIVKHLFAVPNIIFVLVMNRTQLEASVRNEYGTADASKYLQKFINLWVSLPKVHVSDERTTKVYLRYCVKKMGMDPQNPNEEEWIKNFEELVIYYNLSLREIERSLTNFSFLRIGLENVLNYSYRWISVYLCIIKVRYSDEYHKLLATKIEYSELFKKTHLIDLQTNWIVPGEKVIEGHPLKWLLRYYLSSEAQKDELLSAGNPIGAIDLSMSKNAIENISRWLDSFRTR